MWAVIYIVTSIVQSNLSKLILIKITLSSSTNNLVNNIQFIIALLLVELLCSQGASFVQLNWNFDILKGAPTFTFWSL